MRRPPSLTDEPALVLQTLNNLADAMVAAAEAHSDLGQHEQAATLYRKAMQAYNRACSLSSSENGDDLPGLLHNWGSGLHSAGSHVQVRLHLTGSHMQAVPTCYTGARCGYALQTPMCR